MSEGFIADADRQWRQMREESRLVGDGVKAHSTQPPAADMLDKTKATITDRRATYGPPTEHFSRTIGMLNALFAHKLRVPLTVEDWPQIMMCDKMARHQGKPIEDNPVDCAGYAACWFECLTNDSQQRP